MDDCVLTAPRLADDDRARRSCDVFRPGTPGDINLTWAYPNRIVAWRRHQRQTDHWDVIKGHPKVGLMHSITEMCNLDHPDKERLTV